MKRWIWMVLAFLLAVSGGANAFANEVKGNAPVVAEKKGHMFRMFKDNKQFQELVHRSNQLEIERLELKKQIVQKRDQLFQLHVKADAKSDQKKSAGWKANHEQMRTLHGDMHDLRKEAHAVHKSMRDAMRNNDEKATIKAMEQWISLNAQINNKLLEKSSQLDKMISQHK